MFRRGASPPRYLKKKKRGRRGSGVIYNFNYF